MSRLDIVVVGAGIGGLTTALELHRAGLSATVLEAVDGFGDVGVGINILPHASQIFSELGLEERLSSVAVITKESAFFNRFGQEIYSEPAGRAAGYAYPQYSIHRADLHQVLIDETRERLGPDSVRTGARVTRVHQDDDKVTVEFVSRDGEPGSLQCHALIAADGIHSKIRQGFFPDEGAPKYSGVMMWRGVVPWQPFLSGASMVRAGWLSTGKLVIYPIRNEIDGEGRQLVNWVAEVEAPRHADRDWGKRGALEDFQHYFEDWHFDWLDVPAMLAATPEILEYPMVDQDPLPRWTHGRITLLGDAAHPMVPRGSNGAGQAILDARAIANCLAETPSDPAAALQHYEKLRLPATARVVLANRTNPPDAILREVHLRTGDRPFTDIGDVIRPEELKQISDRYRETAGIVR